LINNLVRVSDVHHQKIEQVRGEGKTSNDYKQTQRVENSGCTRAQGGDNIATIGGDSSAAVSYSLAGASATNNSYSTYDAADSSASYGSASAHRQSYADY